MRSALTPGHGGDDLAEGTTAQLVLRQHAELVARVWLQVLHQEVLSPRRHRQRHPIVVGTGWVLHPAGTRSPEPRPRDGRGQRVAPERDSQRRVPNAEPLEVASIKAWLPGDVGRQQQREHGDVGDGVRTGSWHGGREKSAWVGPQSAAILPPLRRRRRPAHPARAQWWQR